MKKKVLYICNDCALGGASQSLRDSLIQLEKFVDIFVVVPSHGPLESFFEESNINYEIIPFVLDYGDLASLKTEDGFRVFVDNYSAAKKISEVIRREQIQLVHVNSSVSNVGAFAALMCGIPYIYHIRELMPEQFNCDFYDWDVKKKVFDNADALISISDFVRDTYLKKYGLTCFRIYNGLNISKYYKKIIRKWTSPRFIVSGNVTPEKGQRIAVQALSRLSDRGYSDVYLDIVGGGDKEIFKLRKYIQLKGLANQIFLHGFQNDQTEFRQNCDYALTVSRNEALGRVTIEAMLAGQFVIGADEGGTKEIIGAKEERGLLFAHGDVVALADKMEQAILMPASEKEKIVQTAQEYALSTFSYESYASSLSNIYNKICDEYNGEKKKDSLLWLESKYNLLSKTANCGTSKSSLSDEIDTKHFAKRIRDWFGSGEGTRRFSEYFNKNSIRTVAVYGMGAMGILLCDALSENNISIVQMIDAGADDFDKLIGIKKDVDINMPADLLIVSVLKNQKNLVDSLQKKCAIKIIGLIDLYNSIEDSDKDIEKYDK